MIIGQDFTEYSYYLNNSDVSGYKCNKCDNVIWYPHTRAKVKRDGTIVFYSANHTTFKNIGNTEYKLNICYNCLLEKFPELKDKNKSRIFNTCNKYVKYAFSVSDIDYSIQRKKHGITLNKLIELYGKDDGSRRWSEYCDKQRETNTFEYKNKVYGMSKDDFNKYNKSRACTLDNFISRYGIEDGTRKWDEYRARQAYTNTEEYFINKYGEVDGIKKFKEINSRKALTLDNYTKRLGIELGTSEFKEYINRARSSYSKISQTLFEEVDSKIKELNLTTYYETKNGEFGKLLKSLNRYCKIDYYIKELNLGIEYNGNYWHANPNLYKPDQIVHSNLTASEIWKRDLDRINALKNEHNISIIVIWQDEDDNDRNLIINQIIHEIKTRI